MINTTYQYQFFIRKNLLDQQNPVILSVFNVDVKLQLLSKRKDQATVSSKTRPTC